MAEPFKNETKRYTHNDYLMWPEDERFELIDGLPYAMTPAPSRMHQKICVELVRQISNYLVGKTCEVYGAPFDVRLPQANEDEGNIKNVVQPDILIVCDKHQLDDHGCKGSPDLIINYLTIICHGRFYKEVGAI